MENNTMRWDYKANLYTVIVLAKNKHVDSNVSWMNLHHFAECSVDFFSPQEQNVVKDYREFPRPGPLQIYSSLLT